MEKKNAFRLGVTKLWTADRSLLRCELYERPVYDHDLRKFLSFTPVKLWIIFRRLSISTTIPHHCPGLTAFQDCFPGILTVYLLWMPAYRIGCVFSFSIRVIGYRIDCCSGLTAFQDSFPFRSLGCVSDWLCIVMSSIIFFKNLSAPNNVILFFVALDYIFPTAGWDSCSYFSYVSDMASMNPFYYVLHLHNILCFVD